ncbi:MAG: hypothetical protein NC177_13930 [Ruminococcus flavefaciens]|nr:hypothetical protein [Ruminococcus flavefaciens]
MQSLIRNYEESCFLVKKRIRFLTQQRNELLKSGRQQTIDKLNLEQRIRLLYVEYAQLDEILQHLKNYARRTEKRAET